MAKEDKPLPYEPRENEAKTFAQRLDVFYFRKRLRFSRLRNRLTFAVTVLAAVACVPLILGVGGSHRVFSNGPVTRAHVIFEKNCGTCHVGNFEPIRNQDCQKCHDGPPHPAKSIDTATLTEEQQCAGCHVEHRGTGMLRDVDDRHCRRCHENLRQHGNNVKLASVRITGFEPGAHPEFSPAAWQGKDSRPLRLNHWKHLQPAPAGTRFPVRMPMQCSDCHETDRSSPKGDFVPLTFERHCRACHERELGFDARALLGGASKPAPHTKDPLTIQAHIEQTYRDLLAREPDVYQRDAGRGLEGAGSAQGWLAAVSRESAQFLFEKKCTYCHSYSGSNGEYPVVAKVAPIAGRYVGEGQGQPWFQRGEFTHRAHRAAECTSCHRTASGSRVTTDVLVPKLQDCLPCHGDSGTALDRCVECHEYHNKRKESDKDRRPIQELLGAGK
ncbi:MAG: cytochrome c3 family protein [Bryobacteraceae bacterium]|nr:cytochrome c3 family protein [Bryobacteraceae bacterium]